MTKKTWTSPDLPSSSSWSASLCQSSLWLWPCLLWRWSAPSTTSSSEFSNYRCLWYTYSINVIPQENICIYQIHSSQHLLWTSEILSIVPIPIIHKCDILIEYTILVYISVQLWTTVCLLSPVKTITLIHNSIICLDGCKGSYFGFI